MNFFNIGGGEILVIILLALLLFGPKDIMNIMRTIGKYTRQAARAWAQLTAGLQGELLPDEVQDVVDETRASIAEVSDTLKEVGTVVKETGTTVQEEGRAINQSLQVTVPNATAEVQAEIRKKKAERASKSADVEGILAMVGRPKPVSPPPTPPVEPPPTAQSPAASTDNVDAGAESTPQTQTSAPTSQSQGQ